MLDDSYVRRLVVGWPHDDPDGACHSVIRESHAIDRPGGRTGRIARSASHWDAVDAEALNYFQTYLRFDTSNPPDDTGGAIAFLQEILQKGGY